MLRWGMSTLSHSFVAAPRRRVLLMALFLSGGTALFAQSSLHPSANHANQSAMKTFVLIFRQNPARERTPAQNQQLAAEMPGWVQRVGGLERKFDPRILAKEETHVGAEKEAATPPGAWPLSALLFVEARDLAEATRIAESHPALKFGTAVEVRAWTAPVPPSRAPVDATAPADVSGKD